jgi:uroporphyrinogen-III synthase
LRTQGVDRVITPRSGAGLAALLEEPALRTALAGARVLLVCGRPLNRGSLARLAALGARPEAFCAYERRGASEAAPLEEWIRQGAADAIMVSSIAAVDALAALARRARLDWRGLDWIASSPRVAAAVRAREGRLGAVAESANARALVAAANEWWSSKQQ